MSTAERIMPNWTTGPVAAARQVRVYGRMTRALGLLLEGEGLDCGVGDLVDVLDASGQAKLRAEVVGFRDQSILMMPLQEAANVRPGDWISAVGHSPSVTVGSHLLGQVLDGMGVPLHDEGNCTPGDDAREMALYRTSLNPMQKARIHQPMSTGVRVLDGLLTLGEGQRIGVFAGGGVGKSKLLGMIAGQSAADINVIALIGERGREVREFVERELTPEGRARTVVVAVTADQTPLMRLRGAYVATAVAEYFRDAGQKVLLMMDSVTRFAMARREVGLSIGEPPATKGYTPSVFSAIPALLERAGMGLEGGGSITGIYTVLVEGDDMSDPIADTLRAALDGHIVLSRELAAVGHFPAVDVGHSVSRVMPEVVNAEQLAAARQIRALMAVYEEARDLITIGAYQQGNRADLDQAVALRDEIETFVQQGLDDLTGWDETQHMLQRLAARVMQ